MNLIDCYLNYCKVLKLELKTRQTSKQTNIQTNRELKNWGASSLRRKRNSGLSGPIPQCMTNVCMFSQSSQSLPVTIKIVKVWSAACNAMYCNVTQARCPTLVWHWHNLITYWQRHRHRHRKLVTYKGLSIYYVIRYNRIEIDWLNFTSAKFELKLNWLNFTSKKFEMKLID